jgi:cytosol alanyl aminopeptidase
MTEVKAVAVAVTLLAGAALFAQQPPTLKLPDTVSPVSYRAELTLDPNKVDFSGFIRIKIKMTQPVQTIWLNGTDITIADAILQAAGKTLNAKASTSGGDFIGLQFSSSIDAGAAELEIHYTAKLRLKDTSGAFRGEDNGTNYIYTQFEPTDARAAFPCFDEPSYKVPWQLTLHVPPDDTAISNTPIDHEQQSAGSRTYFFKETKPLPSYLIAFAVGPFDYVEAGTACRRHVPVRIVTPKGHATEAQYAAKVTATVLTRLEDYFGVPYPYEKSDSIAVPLFGGAMENPGLVTYGQTIILGNPARDTAGRQRGYVSIAAHELAHQWFGDLVTTAWWNDIWLNEAFATWTEEKIVAEWKPEWQTRVGDVDSKLGAEGEDSLTSARKIRQEISTKDDIGNAFDSITYEKGAAVIGMFESYMGPEQFRQGVQSYLKQYAFRNSTAPEFLDAISSASHKNVTQAFSTFLNQTGVPLVSVSLDCKQSTPMLHLEQQRFVPLGLKAPPNQLWQIPVCIRYGSGDASSQACTLMTQVKQDWPLQSTSCPSWIQANGNAVGYYRVDYQGDLLASLVKGDVQNRLTAPERVDLMGNAQSLSTAGKLPAATALALVEVFHDDPERYVVQRAFDMALAPAQHLVPENLELNYQRFIQKNFAARAHALGWQPKADEPDNIRLLRPSLLRMVATFGGDQELATQARVLTDGWFQDHSSLDPNLVFDVLNTAAYYGDKTLFDRFLAELKKTKDRQDRRRIIEALSSFRDPAAIAAGKEALLSGEIPFLEAVRLLFAGTRFPASRKVPFEFLKAHYDEILAKRTGGVFDYGSFFPHVGDSFCDAESEGELKSFFEPRVDKLLGARHTLSEVLEGIDTCIAAKAAQEAGVTAFLAKY